MAKMIPRMVRAVLAQRLRRYPAVALIGPRQCGKTTLAKAMGGEYFDLEDEADRLRLDLAWSELAAGKKLIILDEAQTWPEIFPRLRSTIDKDRKRAGRFLLLGSVSPMLMQQVSQSLAGRLSLVELTPLLLQELPRHRLDDLWLCGGYPEGGILSKSQYPQWQYDYLALLAQRDLPAWGLPASPKTTDRLMRMIAAVHAQEWNASRIGQSLGLTYKTVNSYMDYMVGSFLIRRLEPYHANIRKRLVKRPKVYWRDSGLVHALLQVRDYDHLLAQPWVGASWEAFVVEQILGHLNAWGRAHQAFHFRTSDQYELDLVLELPGGLWAVETKLTASPSVDDVRKVRKAADLIGADLAVMLSTTGIVMESEGTVSTNLQAFLKMLQTADS